MTVRWGIWGPGRIAATVAGEFALAEGAELVAVGSRSQERADAFAAEHGVATSHGSLAALLADDGVDAVYVATPHGVHVEECTQIAAAGKHLLVEKSMAVDPAGTEAIIAAAREHGVFCMEAMWTRFLPVVVEARRRVAAGEIGEVRTVQGDLHAFRAYDPADRLFAPDLGGGALLDLGVYVVAFAHDVLGAPDVVQALGHPMPNGVDGTVSMNLGYADGRTASLSCAFETYGPGRMVLMGTRGWLEIEPRFHHPSALVVHPAGGDAERVEIAPTGKGYAHEIEHASARIAAGETESDVMPLQASLDVSRVLAQAAAQL